MMTTNELPSERRFGLLLAVVLVMLCGYGVHKHWGSIIVAILFVTSTFLALTAILIPGSLAPINRAWFHIGQLLGKIVSPIVLGIIFFGLLTPIAVIARLMGRDELRLKRHNVESYWVGRSTLDQNPNSFKSQF